MFEGAAIEVRTYPYYDPATGGLKYDALRDTLGSLPRGSVVLLHACCHNPTGVDLARSQWDALVPLLAERGLLPYLDLAYQGYGEGIEEDAYPVRLMAAKGLSFVVANSFSKSMSVYGERAGALSFVCADRAEADLVLGQLKATVRRNYSSPPIHAGGIVARVLDMRQRLHAVLSARLPGHDFGYFLGQRGMFSYTGLSPGQVDRLREDHAVYLVRSGRMCVAGLSTGNVQRVAEAFAAVL
jgi:aromatic-amino-acid transaminase